MVKRCAYRLCKSDTRYPKSLSGGVQFFPFPKPKTQLERCLQWIKQCGRLPSQLNVSKINKHTYVCSKHFVNGQPTLDYPNPILAVQVQSQSQSQRRKHLGGCQEPPKQRFRASVQDASIHNSSTDDAEETTQHFVGSDVQIKEEPEEQSIKQEEEQLPQFSAVCVKSEESSLSDVQIHWSPEPSLKQEVPETPQIKEEPAEQSVKQEEEQLPQFTDTSPKTNIIITDVFSLSDVSEEPNDSTEPFSCAETKSFCVKSEEQRQTECREEAQGEDCGEAEVHFSSETDDQTDNSSDYNNDEDWEPSSSHNSPVVHNSALFTKYKSAAETRATVTNGHIAGTGAARKHECPFCKQRLATKQSLEEHIRIHTGERPFCCAVCEKTFSSRSTFRTHMKIHTEERNYSCSVCVKTFIRKHKFYEHIERHTVEKPYSCTVCQKAFAYNFNFTTHMRTHTGERPYSCSICKKTFLQRANLSQHMKTHCEERPGSCSVCNKQFTRKDELDLHKKTHLGERPYSCIICKKTFIQKHHLVDHMKRHTVERPYSCSICQKSFKLSSDLAIHMRIHAGERPYSCSQCEKSYVLNSHLIAHMRTHTGEKPFSCSTCQKMYATRCGLAKHKRTHTGEKPYSCLTCQAAFASQHYLQKHERTHTEKP